MEVDQVDCEKANVEGKDFIAEVSGLINCIFYKFIILLQPLISRRMPPLLFTHMLKSQEETLPKWSLVKNREIPLELELTLEISPDLLFGESQILHIYLNEHIFSIIEYIERIYKKIYLMYKLQLKIINESLVLSDKYRELTQ